MNKNLTALLIVGAIALTAFVVVSRKNATANATAPVAQNTCSVKGDCPFKNLLSTADLTKADGFVHAHGLAVDVASSSRLYIATHEGLDVLVNDTDLYRVGKNTDDEMGFIAHPTKANVLFASGHPETGGNVGFQKSEDGGVTWKKLSDGINGPVDFHAMTISPIDPDSIYGWYDGTLQRSRDGGVTWELAKAQNLSQPISLTADPKSADRLYVSTPTGFMVSNDRGDTWTPWTTKLQGLGIVLTFDPKNTAIALASTKDQGLLKTIDGGEAWTRIELPQSTGLPLFIAYDPQSSSNVYTLLTDQSLYKSTDGGTAWKKIR